MSPVVGALRTIALWGTSARAGGAHRVGADRSTRHARGIRALGAGSFVENSVRVWRAGGEHGSGSPTGAIPEGARMPRVATGRGDWRWSIVRT